MILAIIPARKGSKGIKRKNLQLLSGVPLIEYTITEALKSKLIDQIMVTTDDKEVELLAKKNGISNIRKRPKKLAGDTASMVDVVIDCIESYSFSTNELPSEIVLLQPTSPLRSSIDIDASISKFRENKVDTLISISEMLEHPSQCLEIMSGEKEHSWKYLVNSQKYATRRQDYSNNYYFINGAIYISKLSFLLRNKKFISKRKNGYYVMPQERSIDIDSPIDLAIASGLMAYKKMN